MEHLSEYFSMAGYGNFIWPAYGVVFIGLLFAGLRTWQRFSAIRREWEQVSGENNAS